MICLIDPSFKRALRAWLNSGNSDAHFDLAEIAKCTLFEDIGDWLIRMPSFSGSFKWLSAALCGETA